MEMLIVVAIIAVLIAVAIPVVNSKLEKAREAADLDNIRGAYAVVMVNAVTEENETVSKTVELSQLVSDWSYEKADTALKALAGEENIVGVPQKGGKATVKWDGEEHVLYIIFEGALPVTFTDDDVGNPTTMAEKYGQIVSFLMKNYPMQRANQRYGYYGNGATDDDKVKIFTLQTGDGQTINEVKDAMKKAGYSDKEISDLYKTVRYAYLDKDGNLLGYHGAGSGGQTKLYVVGYDNNPVSVGGSEAAKTFIAQLIQSQNG